MKKKVLGFAAVAAMVISLGAVTLTQTQEAKANINPHCPNGCIENSRQWCYCFGYYRAQEYSWPQPEQQQ